MAFHYSPKIVTDGLVLYLDGGNTKSYVPGSTIWSDLSTNTLSGSLYGATFSTPNGGSILFDGSNDYVSTNFNSSLGDFTVITWFKPSDSTMVNAGRIMDKDYITGFWTGKSNSGLPNTWGGGILQSSEPYGIYLSGFIDGQWNCLAQSRSGTLYTLYKLNNGYSTTSASVSSDLLNTQNLSIGSENTLSGFFMKGNIGIIQIYNRALSSQEILQNYNATKSRYGL